MTTLTDFLLARIAEDEEWARWAGEAQDAERSRGLAFVSSVASSSVTSAGRVLARCAADRRIVERAREAQRASDGWTHERLKADTRSPLPEWARNDAYAEALRDLASVYADHPDYDETWRP